MSDEIPYVEAVGTHREVGRQIGEATRDLVRQGLDSYAATFPVLAGFDLAEAARRARPLWAAAEAFAPQPVDYLRGVAEGAAVPLDDLLAVNCTEEFTCLPDAPAPPGHCTSFAFLAGDRLIAGHNEDWYPDDADRLVVRRIALTGGPAYLNVGAPHNLPFTGVTSHGLCSAANTVYSHDMAIGVPNAVVLAAVLECATLEAARELIARAPRARGSNHLLVDAGGRIWDIETTASRLAFIDGGACFAHANHYVDEELAAQDATTSEGTFKRRERALELIGAGLAAGTDPMALARSVLRDHANAPLSICSHWDDDDPDQDQSVSTASMVWEPAEGRLHVARGQPCEHEYATYTL